MDNAVDAIKMAFGMLVFVIAMTATIYLFNSATATTKVLLYAADKTNYYDNIEIKNENITNRNVNIETIVPTLYRYYKENFAVQIYKNDGTLVQIFDLNIEGKVRRAAGKRASSRTAEENGLMSLYGVSTKPSYLFEAPWMGNTSKDIKTRIDLYVNGKCGYINGTKVDYTANNLKQFSSTASFTERFIQYNYKGDTISVGEDEGEDGIETITGNVKPETKIVIIYKEN